MFLPKQQPCATAQGLFSSSFLYQHRHTILLCATTNIYF